MGNQVTPALMTSLNNRRSLDWHLSSTSPRLINSCNTSTLKNKRVDHFSAYISRALLAIPLFKQQAKPSQAIDSSRKGELDFLL